MNRDKILEQALTHELRDTPGPATADCLDAEALAAWEDGGLDAKAMEAAELHASTCARCQGMLATMSRGVPVSATVEQRKGFRLWSWWLAPIAAATAAVTLWIVVPQEQQIATAPPASKVAPAEPAPKLDAAPPNVDPVMPKDRAQAKQPAAPTFADRDDRRERQAAAPPAEKKEENAKLLAKEAVAQSADAAAAPAAPAARVARVASAPIEIASPNSTRRWRIVPGGVEFSTDQGASWMPVRANGSEALTGGISPSGTICWLIGKNGVVLVTNDGSIFANVDLPVRVDVTSIVASDARSASVTTADGRTFHTDDSGRNWRQN